MADPVNLSALVADRASEAPDHVALVEVDAAGRTGRTRTWAELETDVVHLARGLDAEGLVAGHRVAFATSNRLEAVTCYLAVLRGGRVAVPLNPRASADEVGAVLRDATVRLLVTDAPAVADAAGTARDGVAPSPDRVRVVRAGAAADAAPGAPTYDDLLATGRAATTPTVAPADPEALAVVLYTSGTSGRPRGVMLTHRALLANVAQVGRADPPLTRSDDVVLGLLPLFHVYGLNAVLGQVLATGATLVLVDGFDADGLLDVVRRLGVTNLPLAPPVVAAWAGREDLAEALSGTRMVLSGSAPLDADLVAAFVESAGVPLEQGYGLTETAPVLTTTVTARARPHGDAPKPGTVGAALPGVRLRVLDGSGRDARPGDPGEIWVSGDNLFSGYWPDGEGGPGDDGWYATGDVGVLDGDGDLTLVDRLRELVIVSGFNVYPSEVEEVIAEVHGVAEAAVIGVPDPATGEAVHAFVVPDEHHAGQDLVAAVHAHCETRLARFKWPRQVVVSTGLPHSATGKVAKGRLRAQARRDLLGLS